MTYTILSECTAYLTAQNLGIKAKWIMIEELRRLNMQIISKQMVDRHTDIGNKGK